MDLQKIIKHHRYEAEHAQRLRALVAANFHIKAAEALEDIERRFGVILKTKTRLNQLLASHTGQTEQQIQKDSDRDFWMSAQEAQQYGIVDKVVEFQRSAL